MTLTTQQPPDLLSDNKMELSLSYNCFLCPAVGKRRQQRRKQQEIPRLLSFRDEGRGCLTLARLWPIDNLTQALKHHAVNHSMGAELPEGQFGTQNVYEETTAFVRRDASLHASNRAKNKIHNVLLPCPICRLRKNGCGNDAFACCLMCLKDHYGILHKQQDLLHIALTTVQRNYGQDQHILKFVTSLLDARCVLCLRLFDTSTKKDKHEGEICIMNHGNNVSGKLHASAEAYSNLKICCDRTEFQSYLEPDSFVDFYPLTDKVCLMRFDGISIPCRNLPTISSRTYSSSKLFLWRHALAFQARLRHFGRFASSRYVVVDSMIRGRDGGRAVVKSRADTPTSRRSPLGGVVSSLIVESTTLITGSF
jgi:hypothetical protein